MTTLVALAILWPLASAVVVSAVGSRFARALSAPCIAVMLLLAVAVSWSVARHGALHLHAGGWAPPLGISLHADGVSALLLLTIAVIAAILGATRAVITTGTQDARWFALWFFVWAALNALVLSNDIFNLYVTLELATLGAVGMIAIGGARDGFRVALRYMLFALPGSLIYLLGVALFYASYDTLDLGLLASRMEATPATWAALLLMFAGLALKAALFPLHAWLPPVYAAAPPIVAAMLAAIVGKAPFLILLKMWDAGMPPELGDRASWIFGALAAGAIVWGSSLALWHGRLRLVLAYSSVAHTGYMFLAFAIDTPGASYGAVYVAVSHALAIASLFLVVGALEPRTGSDALDAVRGLSARMPLTFYALALSAVSIMGMPPSGGFIGKWLLLRAAVESELWWIVAVLIAGSLLAAGYMFKVLCLAFVPGPEQPPASATSQRMQLAALVLAAAAIIVGTVPSQGIALLAGR